MITDCQTNFLYLADSLPRLYPSFFKRFEKLLQENKVDYGFLQGTKDVWAVDYMPVQLNEKKFIQFLYRPPYLTRFKKYLRTISDVDAICAEIQLEATKSDIILDGGNITRSRNSVIMTDRVFVDNPKYRRHQIIEKLYELLRVDSIYFIPELPEDFTGHSDGMVRFLDDSTVAISDYSIEKASFFRAFQKAIHHTRLNYEIVPYASYYNSNVTQANGTYINYLQMENLVFVPLFGLKEDILVLKQFERLFDSYTVIPLESSEIADEGGVLNCISWNIMV